MHKPARSLAVLSVALLTSAAALILGPATNLEARPLTTSVTCTGPTHADYDPAITTSTQYGTVTYVDSMSCLQLLPLPVDNLTASAGQTLVNFPYSCAQILTGFSGTTSTPIVWEDEETSTYTYSFTVERVQGQTISTQVGTITEGKYEGAAATMVHTYTNPNIVACQSPAGVATLDGIVTLTVTG